jgi:hypothetical protein
MFGSGKRISGAQDVTASASIAPTFTGRPIPPSGENRSAVDLIGSTGEVKATPIRQPAHAFFNINSIDRYATAEQTTSQFALLQQPADELANNPASNYNMSLQRNLLSGYFHRLTVTETNLEWNIPTINSQNYIFCMNMFNVSGNIFNTRNVALNPDYYSFTELATQLQQQIRDAFSGSAVPVSNFTVTWSPRAGASAGYCFVFKTNDPNLQMSFNATLLATGASLPLIPGQTLAQGNRALLKFYTMIGITSPILYIDPINYENDVIFTYPSYPTLIYTRYIDIISNKLSQFMRVKDSETAFQADTAVIVRVYLSTVNGLSAPVTQAYSSDISGVAPNQFEITRFDTFAIGSRPFVLNYSPITVKNINWSPGQSIVDFDIRVIDEFGDVLPWNLANTNPADNQAFFSEFFEFQLTTLASET